MSHHIFQTALNGRPLTVDLGWDRPLHYVFMTVSSQDLKDHPDDDSSPYLCSNLDDESLPIQGTQSVEYFQDELTDLGISLLSIMLQSVQDDQDQDVGDKTVEYQADGSVHVLFGG
jgi:hypothetical protein